MRVKMQLLAAVVVVVKNAAPQLEQTGPAAYRPRI
jgi:hypothetical protein